MKKASEAKPKPKAVKRAPKLKPDVATFGGPIVYRVHVTPAAAAVLQADHGFRVIAKQGDTVTMGADAHALAKYKGTK